jgi:hypothetical protein
VNAAVTGLSALPGAARPFAAARAMTRFLNHEGLPFPALIEPAQDSARSELAGRPGRFVLVVHDWCMFNFNTHSSKRDRYRRSHDGDLGYELGTALAVDADDGGPLGPMEFRLRTAGGMLSTRLGGAPLPPGHVDELDEAMAAADTWGLGRTRSATTAVGTPPATGSSSAPTTSGWSSTGAASASWARWSPGWPAPSPRPATRGAGPRW